MLSDHRKLSLLYRYRFQSSEHYRQNVWRILCRNFFSRWIDPEFTVLDLGAGWGEFINSISAGQKYAMDLNPEMNQHLNQGIIPINQDCSKTWPLNDESLDCVFTSNLFEHLPDRLTIEMVVEEAHRCLKRQGRLICLGPNIKYVNNDYWAFWDHIVPITDSSLCELLCLKGFIIELCIPAFLPYSMSKKHHPSLFLVRLYLKLSWLWPWIGKQFYIIAQKQSSK